jgi:hypothetical protein
MAEEQDPKRYNYDELLIALNSEEVKAGLQNIGTETQELINDVLTSVHTFLKKIG